MCFLGVDKASTEKSCLMKKRKKNIYCKYVIDINNIQALATAAFSVQ